MGLSDHAGSTEGKVITDSHTVALYLFTLLFTTDCDKRALVPIRILTQRTVGFGCILGGSVIMAISVLTIYLPFYFQAAKGASPATSGLYILALGIPNSLATVACGLAMTTTKHYVP